MAFTHLTHTLIKFDPVEGLSQETTEYTLSDQFYRPKGYRVLIETFLYCMFYHIIIRAVKRLKQINKLITGSVINVSKLIAYLHFAEYSI